MPFDSTSISTIPYTTTLTYPDLTDQPDSTQIDTDLLLERSALLVAENCVYGSSFSHKVSETIFGTIDWACVMNSRGFYNWRYIYTEWTRGVTAQYARIATFGDEIHEV